MPPSVPPADVLREFAVPHTPSLYVIGSLDRRVTFLSQQTRALNFVWSALATKNITPDHHVAIVGGGLAGMTVAAALARNGIITSIYEQNNAFMHMQRTNNTRYVHPHISEWPATAFNRTTAHLPFLNWHAAKTRDVFSQVNHDWAALTNALPASQVSISLLSEIKQIARANGQWSLLTSSGVKVHDTVVLAVGFGQEKQLPPVPFSSYWTDDALHQDANGHYLVCGCGDGGLVETCRLCVMDFKQSEILQLISEHRSLAPFASDLMELDDRVSSLTAQDQSTQLHAFYESLPLDELLSEMKQSIRRSVKVTLCRRTCGPFTIEAARINRLAVYILMKLGVVEFIRGTPDVRESKGVYHVVFYDNSVPVRSQEYKAIAVRTGVDDVVSQYLCAEQLSAMQIDADRRPLVCGRHWPDGFYAKSELAIKIERVADFLREQGFHNLEDVPVDVILALDKSNSFPRT